VSRSELPPQFPRMPYYPRDFASATRGWPLVARGVYHELLDAQWDSGGCTIGTLPDDQALLRDVARVTPSEWKVAWRYVEPKFPRVDGGRRNARLEQHREVAIREFLGRQKGAHATNAKRWGRASLSDRSLIAERVAERVASESPPSPSPSPSLQEAYEGGGRVVGESLRSAEGEL
jgi:uncharacterized protein YdaU (DUF1376 family)